ncbi:FAD/NAD(P)-binding domain-containing protein [Violaceomyces palustris]|uniref:FAD/NAD(P)-binding domain-containing protein n=1 Tax=Violaceomyces palustris TaxID=1673888 RepID=A0ACD0NUQ8_9BASI|nr:FAD/NAD(P)-binding domain-containing protein [Violaceomyces palustris]
MPLSIPRSASTARQLGRCYASISNASSIRSFATHVPNTPLSHDASGSGSSSHKVVVVGGGAAGMAVSHQLLRTSSFKQGDIAVIDPSEWHHYQPGWTLVGAGLKTKEELRRPLKSLLDPQLKHYQSEVSAFKPDDNLLTTSDGRTISYEHLVVVPGISINYGAVKGLQEALQDSDSLVSSIYGYDTCDKVFNTISKLKKGKAIFTQPAGLIKCAGAPQKAMWLALDHWKSQGLYNPSNPEKSAISIDFATGMPVMFGVPKYNAVLEAMRKERGVGGLFEHNLVAIEDGGRTAVFSKGGEQVRKEFDLMHVTPPMGARPFVKESPLADAAGLVDVDQHTTRHKKYANVWSIGDASSLPTSKTAAAITAEAPVLVRNLTLAMSGKEPDASYDGYTSCPLLTEYGKVLLAEFKYGGQPKETFGNLFGIDQGTPRTAFYHLKKDFFPWVYYQSYVKGTWAGPKGWASPAPPVSSPPSAPSSSRGFSTSARAAVRQSIPGNRRGFATSVSQSRNTPSRRQRDPLDYSPNAVRHPLSSGETFIVRPPPTAGSSASTTLIPQPLLSRPPTTTEDAGPLPPALAPSYRQGSATISNRKDLTPDQIEKMQRMREADPITWTAAKLAKKFRCSPTFVSIVAPLPKAIREGKKAKAEEAKLGWGLNKRIARAERAERRSLW